MNFFKKPNLEPPRDALDRAARDAISEIEAIEQAARVLLESVSLAEEIRSLPLPAVLRDRAAATITQWTAALRRARFAETFETSTIGFRALRNQQLESVRRLAN